MAVSKWEINRIGLIDFWYYDEEEFHFVDGRLLLRGSNGSGKSVTMQSFIPLLLDGNRSPDRLDPFGTKSRKIDNYLLEEGDGREERTAYLYMEFKRTQSDAYMTIGIGFRARRNKNLDSWYFAITDGRRVGQDFQLYRETGNKTTLSKQELKNRLGEGGELMESYREYMKLVNERLFGYETTEEYKELIDLLIQLRTPKLSKDFKPTVLNEILSTSLPPLSEDDLRPMSEAIENMDNLKSRLEALKQAKKAADKIDGAYKKYNQALLYERASGLKNACDFLNQGKTNLKNAQESQEKLEQAVIAEGRELTELEEEQKALKLKKENLDKNDLAAVRQKELEKEKELETCQGELRRKSEQLDRLDSEEKAAGYELKRKEEEKQSADKNIEEKLQEMEDLLGDVQFDEHYFMKDELQKEKESNYSFMGIKSTAADFAGKVDNGCRLLQQDAQDSRDFDNLQKEEDGLMKRESLLSRELELAQSQTLEIKAELAEAIYKWNGANHVLRLDDMQLQQLQRQIESFDEDKDYDDISDIMRRERQQRESAAQGHIASNRLELEQAQRSLDEKKRELELWSSKTDPEPEHTLAVAQNREKLKAAGIPFYPFYKTLEFDGISEKQADTVEEALMEMGLLDALVIPSNYRDRVLVQDTGMCDKYLFAEAGAVEEGLGRILSIGDEINDLIFHQEIVNLLGNIGQSFVENNDSTGGGISNRTGGGTDVSGKSNTDTDSGTTRIGNDGSYALGVLHGTVTGQYKAKYIGREARKRHILAVLQQLKEEEADLENQAQQAEAALAAAEQELATISREAENFPGGKDLKESVKTEVQLRDKINDIGSQRSVLTERMNILREQIRERRIEISKIAQKVGLEASLAAFQRAQGIMQEYKVALAELEGLHPVYLSLAELCRSIAAKRESLLGGLEDARYDISGFERQIRACQGEIDVCRRQLELGNYEQIARELDECIKRLEEIPGLMREKSGHRGALQERLKGIEAELEKTEQELLEKEELAKKSENAFLSELQLGYLPGCEALEGEAPERCARRLAGMLASDDGRSVSDCLGKLQEQYYANIAELTEYSLQMKDMFKETAFRRQAVYCRYQGRETEFATLVENLASDIELQDNLVNDSDRELFEDILANTISKKIRSRIYKSEDWVEKMNRLMSAMNTSSGLTLSLRWKKKRAEQEEQLDTGELVELLKKDAEVMHEAEFAKLSAHFHSKVDEARRLASDSGSDKSFHAIMREVLDYRKWFEFQLYYAKAGEQKRELTNNAFFTLSGGEKAMAMYVPLFSAVVAKYQSARPDAPRLISLDEAFAGVDEVNIRDMFKLMVEMDFEFIINSQILWGDYDTVPALAIYELHRPENAKFVTVVPYVWNGYMRQEGAGGNGSNE